MVMVPTGARVPGWPPQNPGFGGGVPFRVSGGLEALGARPTVAALQVGLGSDLGAGGARGAVGGPSSVGGRGAFLLLSWRGSPDQTLSRCVTG